MLYATPSRGSGCQALESPRYKSARSPKLKVKLPLEMATWIYAANSLISARPVKLNRLACALAHPSLFDGVVRVRSKQPSRGTKGADASGLEAMFGSKPAPAHWEGSLRAGSPAPTKVPATFCVMQGSFTVGSVSPRLNFSFRNVCS